MEDNVSKIKERVDIVDLVGGYIKLQKAGVNFKARCPFHNEKSGSFFVTPERQIWHCFGCGLGGDIFTFIQQIEGLEFPDALRMLAGRAGIELSRIDPKLKNSKSKLYEICELASKFFEKQLSSNVGKSVLQYLHDRAVTDESIRDFRLGYAPDSWQALSDFLTRNYDHKDIADAGLIIKKDHGGYYDRFRSRIMFPIFDANGQVVGFSGRVFGSAKEETAKYVNTPQTAIYDKGRILYGLHRAKLAIRRANRCLAVEGNLDVILSHQAGITHAVASCGTALTIDHLKIIRRYTDTLDLCFDADSAGMMATDRGIGLALAGGFNLSIVAIREADLKDPADYVKKYGNAWQDYVAKNAKPFLEFYFAQTKENLDMNTALSKKQFTQKIIPLVASLTNSVEQAHWITEIALLVKEKEEVIRHEVLSNKPKLADFDYKDDASYSSTAGGLKPTQPLDMLEEGLFSLLIHKPSLLSQIPADSARFLSEYSRGLLRNIQDSIGTLEVVDVPNIMAHLRASSDEALTMSLEFVYLKSQESWRGFSDTDLDKEFQGFIGQLKKRAINARLEGLQYDIRSAERHNDKERLGLLLNEFSKTSRELVN